MTKYVVGFLINGEFVALIKKTHPDWQKGRLNGIGGHIEKDEAPVNAMVREFKEETGADVYHWRPFCLITGNDYELHCYTSTDRAYIASTTDEKVGWYKIDRLNKLPVLPNLMWLIPMANYKYSIDAIVRHDNPEC